MESNQKEQPPVRPEHHDIDLGTVLYKMGQAANRFMKFIGDFFKAIFQCTMLGLLFLRRNILWLVLGGAAGLGYGIYYRFSSEFRYVSVSTVKMSFESTRTLYGTLDYINALRSRGKIDELSKIFNISAKEAMSISSFEATPVMSDLSAAEMYKDMFLKYRRNENVRQDTFWTKTIKFDDFKKQLTKYDYPMQDITVVCTDPEVFSKLQQGLVNQVSQSETLKHTRELLQRAFNEENSILENSLKELDSLSASYNRRIQREGNEREGAVSNLNILDKTMIKAPELDLYNTKMLIKDELTALHLKNAKDQEIMQVYSPFSSMGEQQRSYNQSYLGSTLNGVILAFAILLGIALFRFLGKFNPNTLMKE
jgi:hypothetical protein